MDGNSQTTNPIDLRVVVRDHYGALAEKGRATSGCGCAPVAGGCCGSTGESATSPASAVTLYEDPDVVDLPDEVTGLALGCGDPVTLASLQPGQTVLDLGSGGGIDCFLAARKVGPGGRVIGVDMTAAMIERARANREQVGAFNVEFRLGEIEHLPVADSSVDVIISNCVINLSPDKQQVLNEAYRALRPGGRLAISDVVTDGPLPAAIKGDLAAWAGCVAGALDREEFRMLLEGAGFTEITVTPVYWGEQMLEEAAAQLDLPVAAATEATGAGQASTGETDHTLADLNRAVFSARITARKPG